MVKDDVGCYGFIMIIEILKFNFDLVFIYSWFDFINLWDVLFKRNLVCKVDIVFFLIMNLLFYFR